MSLEPGALMLVDRENGRGAAAPFCETEGDLRMVAELGIDIVSVTNLAFVLVDGPTPIS